MRPSSKKEPLQNRGYTNEEQQFYSEKPWPLIKVAIPLSQERDA